jgi:hypothetical protein
MREIVDKHFADNWVKQLCMITFPAFFHGVTTGHSLLHGLQHRPQHVTFPPFSKHFLRIKFRPKTGIGSLTKLQRPL